MFYINVLDFKTITLFSKFLFVVGTCNFTWVHGITWKQNDTGLCI